MNCSGRPGASVLTRAPTDKLPQQIGGGQIEFMGVPVEVVILDDGRRLIAGDGMERILLAMAGRPMSQAEADQLVAAIKGAGVQ